MFSKIKTHTLGDDSRLDIYQHTATGLRHAHLYSAASGNQSAGFAAMLVVPTPAEDNSGATHALEHMVLCGSRRFPYRDAFFRMERRSMALHLNAVTNEWLSTFHFHTPSEPDLHNLLEFLLDGVFSPLLLNETFEQEVVRQIDGDPPAFSGVVYNEMRALTAMPGTALDVAVRRQVFSNSPFGYLSGGNPADIERLSRERVQSFHRSHYQTSKAWLLSFGDIDVAACQKVVDTQLSSQPTKAATPSLAPVESKTQTLAETDNQGVAAIELAGGIEATVLVWDRGWRADEYAYLEAHLLLDLLNGRPDSLLRQGLVTGIVAAPHLNVIDGQASRTVMRIGFGRKAGDGTELIDHEALLHRISQSRPDQLRLDQALDRLELLYVNGGLRGSGVDPVNQLRQTAEKLCAAADDDELKRWLNQPHPLTSLRQHFRSPEDCVQAFQSLCNDRQHLRRFRIDNRQAARSVRSGVAAPAKASVVPTTQAIEKHPLPIVALADLPAFPDSALLDPAPPIAGTGTMPELVFSRLGVAATSRVILQFELPDTGGAMASALVYRIEHEARHGALSQLVSTQIQVDGWAAVDSQGSNQTQSQGVEAERDVGTAMTGGIKVSLTGLSRHVDEQLRAIQRVLQMPLDPTKATDSARLQAQQLLPNARSERLEACLRTGHVTAVAAALRQQSGFTMLHYGSGLGLLLCQNDDLSAFDDTGLGINADDSFARLLRRVIVDTEVEMHSSLQSELSALLAQATPQRGLPSLAATRTSMSSPSRSLFRVTGSVNYLARVFVPDQLVIDVESMATSYVFAAALRNTYLLDAVRSNGGAYGTGIELVSNALAIWSYRDPRLEASFSDFDRAVANLALHGLTVEQLHEAKLSALTQLNRRYTQNTRPPSSLLTLAQEWDCGRAMVSLYLQIAQVSAQQIKEKAQSLDAQSIFDVALVGKNWRGNDENEFDRFDYRNQRLVHK